MGLFTDTQAALDQRLSTVSGLPSVAWENILFKPVKGTTFIRPVMLSAASTMETIEARLQSNPGIYQIDVFVDTEKGPAALNTLVDTIFDHFKAINTLTEGTTDVWLQAISRSPAIRDESWFKGTILINYTVLST